MAIERGRQYRLDEVIGWSVDKADARQCDDPARTVAFTVDADGTLTIMEQCDDYFGIDLTPGELDLLIAWLVEARGMLP
jgi:hypothetical protein